jgi:hypothetical protein
MAGAGVFAAPRPSLANAFVRRAWSTQRTPTCCYAWDAWQVRSRPPAKTSGCASRFHAERPPRPYAAPGTPFLERIQGNLQERARDN